MRTLRTAIIGCGGIANYHAKLLSSLERIEIVALCDLVTERAEDFNERYADGRAEIFTEYRVMFQEMDLDLVYICLPPFAHSDEVQLAAERGMHIFIEKPIALDLGLAREMTQAVEASGVKSQVGFMFRFGQAIEYLKEALADGSAGAPGLMVARYFCNSLHAPWWRVREKSGGQVMEQIIHIFDLARYLLGRPETVYCRQANLFHREVEGYTAEDVSGTVVSFENGALAVVGGTNCAIPGQWIGDYRVVTERITADFTDANHATFYHTTADPVWTTTISSERELRLAETLDLIRAIDTNGQTRTPIREGAETLALVLAASESAEKRAEVEVPEI